MTQASIPVQPGETDVTAALRQMANIMGCAVMATTNGAHAKQSYHYSGQAVDLAATSGPSYDSYALLDINEQIIRLIPMQMILELIYSGPGNVCIRNGRPYAYGGAVMSRHHNHVHLAVVSTFTYTGGTMPAAADDPTRSNANAPIVGGMAAYNDTGDIKGYILIGADGGTFHFGAGVPQHGNMEYVRPANREWLPKA